jgi:hypothetical protein
MIDHVEQKRAAAQHLRKVVRMAGGGQNAGVDPDDSYYGDDEVLDSAPRPSPGNGGGGSDTGGTEAF